MTDLGSTEQVRIARVRDGVFVEVVKAEPTPLVLPVRVALAFDQPASLATVE